MLFAGFAYVSVVLCNRPRFWESGNDSFGEFVFFLTACSGLFLLGPRHNWLPNEPSFQTCLAWSGLGYVVPFFAMLHWEYVGDAIGANFSLTGSDLTSLTPTSLAALIAAVVAIVMLLALHFRSVWKTSGMRRDVLWLGVIPIAVTIITMVLAESHRLHVHHYCLGMFLFPLFRFRNRISVAAQAAFLGLAVEGVARWGMDPVWYHL